ATGAARDPPDALDLLLSPHAEVRGCKPCVSKHEGACSVFAAILRDARFAGSYY
ncbi:MAG: hypothetical protein V7608_1918, partial [Hyphomicrobiales bacterium]